MLVRRRPKERLLPNCLWSRHPGPTRGVMVWLAISFDHKSTIVFISKTVTAFVLQPSNSAYSTAIYGGVFLPDNAHPRTTVVTQRAVQRVDELL
ncbi:uncharacterized protein TNCV_4850941 [Trichonephila clavipes]|nr:uncharacterized protein TNCV_4850941 [Trichonephila clavipes]